MVLALIFALLAAATLAAVALPLLRPAHGVADRGQFDRAVYRDQLKELERDLARGVISPVEAHSARLEIQRRLLAAEGRSARSWSDAAASPWLATGIIGFVLIAAGGLYTQLGSPSLPDMPFASRHSGSAVVQDSQHIDMKDAAAKLRAKLQTDPKNAEGWLLYARTESMLGNWDRARDAYNRAMALGENGPAALAGYGEMLVLGQQGIVPVEAVKVFNQVLTVDPKNDVARYYVALADAQAGEVKQAIAGWMSLAADIPNDSPMRDAIARRVADAAQSGGIPTPALPKGTTPQTAAAPNPDEAAMAAAAQMPEAQRKQFIESMVAKLAAQMQSNPNDLQGWVRLGRAYAVLGDKTKAMDAYQHAVSLKPDDVSLMLGEFEVLVSGLQPSDPLPQQAIAVLHQIQKVAPNRPEALWYLGVVAARKGHPLEARNDWTRLLQQLPPGSDDAKMVKAALDQVKLK